MKITDVESMVLDTGKDYSDPSMAIEAHGVRYISLIKISTDEGITGWSDIETQPHTGKSIVDAPSGGQIGFESIRNALIGEDPLEHERLWQKMIRYLAYYGRAGAGMHMISGADIALWDIAGKALGQPICKLLGAKYHDRIKAYASTLFRPNPDDMKRAVAGYLAQGFKAIKFGWGAFGYDFDLDIRLVKAARQEAGDQIDLMVDGGWYGTSYANPYRPRQVRDWSRLAQYLEDYNVFWLEDFLPPDNLSGYAEVARSVRTLRVAAGEQYSGYSEFERLAVEGHIHTLQPDLSRCGGITVARQIAEMSQRMGIDCVPHAWLTDLLKAASLHLNAYLMNPLYLEFNVSTSTLLNNLCIEPIGMVDGYIFVPTGSGLGVEVDEDRAASFRVL